MPIPTIPLRVVVAEPRSPDDERALEEFRIAGRLLGLGVDEALLEDWAHGCLMAAYLLLQAQRSVAAGRS